MTEDAIRSCHETIQRHSKSFALASRLLPPVVRDRAVVVYAWCRRADDAIDLAGSGAAASALEKLRGELSDVYGGRKLSEPTLSLFQQVVHDCEIPLEYTEHLLDGMAMDVDGRRYETMESLLHYCYCVAGTVGLMMCHVMGVRSEKAARNAVHMGMAMQLTNICRDVAEDWNRERLYIPEAVLAESGFSDLGSRLGDPFPEAARDPVARATACLLVEADRYYVSGDAGVSALSWRCALAVRTARRVYSSIGVRIRQAGCDPLAGRAIVPLRQKLSLTAGAFAESLADLARRIGSGLSSAGDVAAPRRHLSFPEDVLPL